MNDFWWGFFTGGVAFLVAFILWFLCTFDVNWDMGDDE